MKRKETKNNNEFNIDYEMYSFLQEHTTQGALMAVNIFEEYLIKDLESAKKQKSLTEDFKQGWLAAYMHILNNMDNVEKNIPSYLENEDQFDILFKRFQEAFPCKEKSK